MRRLYGAPGASAAERVADPRDAPPSRPRPLAQAPNPRPRQARSCPFASRLPTSHVPPAGPLHGIWQPRVGQRPRGECGGGGGGGWRSATSGTVGAAAVPELSLPLQALDPLSLAGDGEGEAAAPAGQERAPHEEGARLERAPGLGQRGGGEGGARRECRVGDWRRSCIQLACMGLHKRPRSRLPLLTMPWPPLLPPLATGTPPVPRLRECCGRSGCSQGGASLSAGAAVCMREA